MKKTLSLVLAFLLLAAYFTGCGKQEQKPSQEENNSVKQTTVAEKTEEETKKKNKLDFDTVPCNVPTYKIVIDMPSAPYHRQELGVTTGYFIYNEQCISLTGNFLSEAKTLADAQKNNIERYKKSIQNYADIDTLTVNEEKNVTINGIEMYRFEGVFNCKRNAGDGTHKQYAVGYTFIMDGVPCSLIGTTLTRLGEQPESVEKDIEAKVDALIQTLRSEEMKP